MTIAFPSEETNTTVAPPTTLTDRFSGISNPEISNPPAQIPRQKRPISQKKLAANRANARKSTGPRTKEGKAKVAQNATTHGLTSAKPPELDPTYCTRLYELKEEHRPTTPSQHYLVEQLAQIAWKLDQIPQIEAHLVAAERAKQTQTSDPNSAFSIQDSTFAELFASHLAQDKPTPLTRLWDHHRRLLSQFQSILRQLPKLRKEQQHHHQQDLNEDKFHEDLARGERIDRLCANLDAHNAKCAAAHSARHNLPKDHPLYHPPIPEFEIPTPPPAQIKPTTPPPSSILNPPSSPPEPPPLRAPATLIYSVNVPTTPLTTGAS